MRMQLLGSMVQASWGCTSLGCRPFEQTVALCLSGPCPAAQQAPGFSIRGQVGASKQICHAAFGDVFSVIGVREPQPAASEAFVKFADAHRSIEKFGIRLLKTIKPVGPSAGSMPTGQSRRDSLAQEEFWAGVRCHADTRLVSPLWLAISHSTSLGPC